MAKYLLSLVLALLAALPASAFEIVEVKSSKGISAWLVRDTAIPLVAINFAFANGSATDAPGKEGSAHFLTAMMDEGADGFSGDAFKVEVEDLGIRLGFSVNTERFEGVLQMASANRDAAAALLAAAINTPELPNAAIDRTRKQMIVMAQSEQKSPAMIAARALFLSLLGDHPYVREVHGTPQSLATITRGDLAASAARIFTRRDLKVSAVGDITPQELAELLDRVFGKLPDAPSYEIMRGVFAQNKATQVIERTSQQSVILFGMPALDPADPEYPAATVMSHMIGGTADSWLNEELRKKRGLTYGAGMQLISFRHAPLYVGSFSTSNGKAGEAVKHLREILQRMADVGPSQLELDDVKTFMTGSLVLRLDSSAKIAGLLLSLQLQGRDTGYLTQRNAAINAVTIDQVRSQAQRLLDPRFLAVVAVGQPEGLQ
jgi:zinc protease